MNRDLNMKYEVVFFFNLGYVSETDSTETQTYERN